MKRGTPRTAALVAILALTVLIVTGCTGSYGGGTSKPAAGGTSTGGTTSAGITVSMKNFAFNPSTIDAKVGEVVAFKNEDSVAHTVNVAGVDSGQVAPGATFMWKADTAGTFPLKCSIHPAMTGTITVK